MNFQGCTLELLGHFLDTTPYSCHHIHQDIFFFFFGIDRPMILQVKWMAPNFDRCGTGRNAHSKTLICIPVVPHEAVAEDSRIGNLEERLVVVNNG